MCVHCVSTVKTKAFHHYLCCCLWADFEHCVYSKKWKKRKENEKIKKKKKKERETDNWVISAFVTNKTNISRWKLLKLVWDQNVLNDK